MIGDRADLALAWDADGALAYMRGDWTGCWQRTEEARAAAPGVDDVEASTEFLQAMVLLGRHDLAAARLSFERARVALAAVRSGRPFFTTMTLGWIVEGAGASPRLYFEETVLPGPRVSAGQAQGYVLCNLGYLARLAGDLDQARTLLDEAVSIFRVLGARDGESMALNHLGCLHRVRAEFAEGRHMLEQSLRIRHEIGDRRAIGLTLGNLGVLTAAEGDVERGVALLEQALAGFRETEDVPGRVGFTLTTASVYANAGDYDAARRLLPNALLESRHIPGNHRATAWGHVLLSEVFSRLGQPDEAVRALARAGDQFRALGAIDRVEPGLSTR